MIEIYCDGAASNNGKQNAVGGYGYFIVEGENIIDLFGGQSIGATNQQMELKAAIEALAILDNVFIIEPTKIYTDSAYLYRCYKEKWWRNWKENGWVNSKKEPVANRELWEKLIPYFQRPDIEFIKVKGHSDTFGNIITDKIAVAVKQKTFVEFIDYCASLKKEVKEIFNDRFNYSNV